MFCYAMASIATLCSERPYAKGLCVIIANRMGHQPKMEILEGVETDRRNMQRTFETLKFAVLCLKDRNTDEMMSLFHDIASYPSYPPSYKRIAVVFAGHGTEEGLCAHDRVVPIKDIIDQFQPANCHPSIRGIPKLFFIDACRGERKMKMVVKERGGTAVPLKVVPQCGNSLVAYSTMAGYKAHELGGGIWMSALSEKLLQDKSLVDIMVDVNKTLMETFQTPDMSDCVQQPTCENTLNEHIYLAKESKDENPDLREPLLNDATPTSSLPTTRLPQRVSSRPQGGNHGDDKLHMNYSSTDRSRSMEHYDGTDVYQQALEAFIKDHWVQGYRESTEPCVMGEKIVYCTKIECTVGVEAKVFLSDCLESEEGSKEQAAMRAIHFIQHQKAERGGGSGGGGGSSPMATNQQGYKMEEASCEAGVTTLTSPRNFRQELHEWCQRNTAKAPRSFETSGQGHRCVITVNGRTFTSKWCDRKKGAEEGAAMEALKWLQTHTVAPPTSVQPGKMRLKEYCEQHPDKRLKPNYDLISNPGPNGPFQCRLTITSPSKPPVVVIGERCASIREAEHNAADKALLSFEA